MEIGDILLYIIKGYLALCIIKVLLLMSVAHISAGVHYDYFLRFNHTLPAHERSQFWHFYFMVTTTILLSVAIDALGALYREGWSFFRIHTKREVIRDSVKACRSIYANYPNI